MNKIFSILFLFLDKLKSKISELKKNKDEYDFKKLLYLGSAFFFIIATYSVIRPLKTSVFLGIVGKEYQPITKLITIIVLIPCLMLYSKLVDKLRRYQVVYFFLGFYLVTIIIAALILLHPVIGLNNTDTNPTRIFGWIFYLLIDLYSPLAVGTFWAFANSISSPNYAKKNYGKIVAFSRIGGIITPLGSWYVMQKITLSYVITIPLLLSISALFLFFACICISQIIKKIPGYLLHGYEAAYKAEKEKPKAKQKEGFFAGLKLLIIQPYVFGIFSLIYIFEAICIILDYQMQVQMSIETNNAVSQMSAFMFLYTASFQILGLIFALFGTSALLKKIGVKYCLLIMPLSTIFLVTGLYFFPSLVTIFVIMVLIRALHYGFNAPVREILYIPTTKDIKFKSKAWIESVGRSISKTSGSAFNLIAQTKGVVVLSSINSIFIAGLSIVWTIISFFVGAKYQRTIKNNEIIGNKNNN